MPARLAALETATAQLRDVLDLLDAIHEPQLALHVDNAWARVREAAVERKLARG